MERVVEFANRGGLVWGICNGFQILCEAHLLPGALTRNASLQFRCEMAHLRVETINSAFTAGCAPRQTLRIPVSHGEGRYGVGMMPHPERAVESLLGSADGLQLFTCVAALVGQHGSFAGVA